MLGGGNVGAICIRRKVYILGGQILFHPNKHLCNDNIGCKCFLGGGGKKHMGGTLEKLGLGLAACG